MNQYGWWIVRAGSSMVGAVYGMYPYDFSLEVIEGPFSTEEEAKSKLAKYEEDEK